MRIIFYIICSSLIFGNYSVIQSGSKVEYFGSHPTHGFSGYSSSITLIADCNEGASVCDLQFSIPIISLNSGNDNRDSNMLNYLKAFSYPEIKLNVSDFLIKDYDGDFISCELNISGITQQIEIPLTLLKKNKNQHRAQSSFAISLDQFGIDIPKLLFIPIDSNIKILIDFLIESELVTK